MPITKRDVDALLPGSLLWDEGRGSVTGFGVRRQRRDCIYLLKYTVAGKGRWYSIGRHGSPWTVEDARTEARRLLGDLAHGTDPQAAKAAKVRQRALTVADLCDRYMDAARRGVILTRFRRPKKASTLAIDVGRVERHIKPLIGQELVTAVTPAMVRRLIQDITAGKTAANVKTKPRGRAVVTGGAGTAARVADLLSGIMTWAVEEEIIASNPVHGVKRYHGEARDRFLSGNEIARLGNVLDAGIGADGKPINPTARTIVKLLLLTGCRAGEIENLRWSEVDLKQRCMRLEDSKTGKSLRALGSAAVEVIKAQPHINDSPYVFPASRGDGPYQGTKREVHRIMEVAKIPDAGRHVLRHTFASIASELGYSDAIIGGLLGHKGRGVTSRYVHRPDTALLTAADKVCKTVLRLMTSSKTSIGSYPAQRLSAFLRTSADIRS